MTKPQRIHFAGPDRGSGLNAWFWLGCRFVLVLVLVLSEAVLVLVIAVRSIVGRRLGDTVQFDG